MTSTTPELTEVQAGAAERIDALDLDPIAYKLMHPEPGQAVMTLAEADELIAAYRRFLKLCAWYPEESIVPSRAIDEVWHAHILDTAKYAADSDAVCGFFLHHFPYFGLRGAEDEAALHAAGERTRGLFRQHFGAVPGQDAGGTMAAELADCESGGLCVPDGVECDKSGTGTMGWVRPRPAR